ncbi:MAG: MFS transporter [Microthrixaceae bacterium]
MEMAPLVAASDSPGQRSNTSVRRMFVSLGSYNYRLFFAGQLVSNTGSWMQTMAEAWLVLTLTGSGAAVGATFAFRFLPVLLFGLWGGVIADRYDQRRLLIVTRSISAVVSAALWIVALTGVVQVWMVFALAIAAGFVMVVDEPAHHAFVEQMVGRNRLSNAVALHAAVKNSARITGPAISGLLVAATGTAWVFFVGAMSFLAGVAALAAMRRSELRTVPQPTERPRVREGIAYTWSLTEIRPTIVLVAVVGTFVYNFPTFLSILARDTFHGDAGLAGLLMAVLGGGTVIGALSAAHRSRQSSRTVLLAGGGLGISLVVASALPTQELVVVALIPVGALTVFFGSTSNAHVQAWSAPQFRGRVMSIYSLLTLGSTVVGGPLMGWVSQQWSARVGLGVAGVLTGVTATVLAVLERSDRRWRRPSSQAGGEEVGRGSCGNARVSKGWVTVLWTSTRQRTVLEPTRRMSARSRSCQGR